jgi:hypothetical protein
VFVADRRRLLVPAWRPTTRQGLQRILRIHRRGQIGALM